MPHDSILENLGIYLCDFWATICKMDALRLLSVCLSCLSVCNVDVLWPNGWMKLGSQVGLGPGHIVLDGDPAPPPPKVHSPLPEFSAHICCCQMAGWVKMPQGREVGLSPSDIVLDRTQRLSPKREQSPPFFGPCLLWPNGWMDQDGTWNGGRPRPKPHCARR